MRKIYGKIFSVYLGNEPLIIVADFDLYKEAMAKDELLYRPKLGANDDFFFPDENGKNYQQHLEGLNNLFPCIDVYFYYIKYILLIKNM